MSGGFKALASQTPNCWGRKAACFWQLPGVWQRREMPVTQLSFKSPEEATRYSFKKIEKLLATRTGGNAFKALASDLYSKKSPQ